MRSSIEDTTTGRIAPPDSTAPARVELRNVEFTDLDDWHELVERYELEFLPVLTNRIAFCDGEGPGWKANGRCLFIGADERPINSRGLAGDMAIAGNLHMVRHFVVDLVDTDPLIEKDNGQVQWSDAVVSDEYDTVGQYDDLAENWGGVQ
jgi:hypothetical protein